MSPRPSFDASPMQWPTTTTTAKATSSPLSRVTPTISVLFDHWNFDAMWKKVQFGGGTRVMTGWQKVKELHFQKHSESATYHPSYGWQPGPQTPILSLLLLLDGEAI